MTRNINVSDSFRRAFGVGGVSHATCNCGRDHGYSGDDDSDVDPAGCFVLLFGAVDGCDCGSGTRHENWIWENRTAIAEYLRERTKEEMARLNGLANLEVKP